MTFTPTAAQKYRGKLMIDTNLESGADKSVMLEGIDKVPKSEKMGGFTGLSASRTNQRPRAALFHFH